MRALDAAEPIRMTRLFRQFLSGSGWAGAAVGYLLVAIEVIVGLDYCVLHFFSGVKHLEDALH
ncbi:MAG: hypothetical protein Kow0031_39370 [Anaerolineae bacterium]